MSNPKSVTIQLKHLHPTLQDAVLAAESRSGEAVRLLNELVQMRMDRASTDALAEETAEQGVADQVRALKLDLAGAQTQLNVAEGTIGGLRAAVAKRDRQIEALTQSLHTRKEEFALKVKKRDEDRVETRAALDHAIELIVYFKGKAEDY
jgi:predicted  nucleic acid-binding Zn-ribbon protein